MENTEKEIVFKDNLADYTAEEIALYESIQKTLADYNEDFRKGLNPERPVIDQKLKFQTQHYFAIKQTEGKRHLYLF